MSDLTIRELAPADGPEVVRLLSTTLGWTADARHERLFDWKHRCNPFGPSLAWVAVVDGRIVGLRAFLRWELLWRDRVVLAARAVDTATHPDHRGAGVFSRLTRHGLAALERAGIEFVFNTPNDQSRPGYLKMGWEEVGRAPLQVRVASVASLRAVTRARVPAELWSVAAGAGRPAADVLGDAPALDDLLASQPPSAGLATRRTPAFLRWRYGGLDELAYRAVCDGAGPAGGVALFRLRRRGPAVEAMIGDVLAPGGDRRRAASLARLVARTSGADYAVAAGAPRLGGFLPLPRQGPVVTWKAVAAAPLRPPIRSWGLSLGDIELF